MKNKQNKIQIVQEAVTAIQSGKDVYVLKSTSDGKGVRIENKQGNIFIPKGDVGLAIARQLLAQVETAVSKTGKRSRRSAIVAAAQKALA